MSKLFISNPATRLAYEIDFPTLVSIIKGTSIISLADSDRYIELGLTEKLLLRIESEAIPHVSVISTLNPDEIPPVRVQLIAEDEEPSAARVEQRLHSLRQIYAITFLLNADREEQLGINLEKTPNLDLEELLDEKDRLYLQAAGPGSWWVTLLTKVREPGQKALNTLSLLFGEGRKMLMDRVRAHTLSQRAKAGQDWVTYQKMRAEAGIEVLTRIEKIKTPKYRKLAEETFLKNANSIDPNFSQLLPPPKEPSTKDPSSKE